MLSRILPLLLAVACTEPRRALTGATRLAPRVVSLHDVTTEVVVASGAAERLVGVTAPIDLEPTTAAPIARVPRVASLESILELEPDLVLGLRVVAEQQPQLVARLRQAGVAVELFDPRTLADVHALVARVAARVGTEDAGRMLLERMRASERAQPPPRARRTRVFVYDCCDPPFTSGARTVLNDLIARAGGQNVFGELDAAWTHVSWEEVVATRPELVVIDTYTLAGQGELTDKQRTLHAIPSLAEVPTAALPLACALGGLRSIEGLARLRVAIGGET